MKNKLLYCVLLLHIISVPMASVLIIDNYKKDAIAEISRFREMASEEISTATSWVTGEYPQWFIEWQNTEAFMKSE